MVGKKYGVLGLLLISRSAAMYHGNPEKESLSNLVSESVTICGNDDIWEDISAPQSVAGVKGIDWQNIEEIMESFLEDVQTLIDVQDQKIGSLQKSIDAKNGGKESRMISNEEIEQLVDAAVTSQASFGSKEAATATNCGKPGLLFNDKRPNPDGYEQSSVMIKGLASELFVEKKKSGDPIQSEYKTFLKVCEDNMGFQRSENSIADDMASYCDEMCGEMATSVQAISNKHSMSRGDVEKLMREKERAVQKKQKETDKKDECESARTRITAFRKYLEDLAAKMSEKHKLFQKAEWALALAMNILSQLTEALATQKQLVEQANQGLTDLGQKETSTKQTMETAQASLEDASADLQKVTEHWKELEADLVAVRAAERFADEVKQRLSKLLLKMDGFAEECVREPVRNIGLSEETDVYEGNFFQKKVDTLSAQGDMKLALSAFHTYCEGTAKEIFALVKDKVDLSPLCELQDQDQTMQEITTAVQKRKDIVVEEIQKVQSWLDPFKGTDATAENEISDYVNEGEPLGLRRVMGPMTSISPNNFYSTYLKKWKKKGEFHDLLAQIKEAIVGLDQKVAAAADEMNRMKDKADQAQTSLDEATAVFQEAAREAQLEKQQVNDALTELKEKVEQQKLSLEDLQRKVKEAKEAWVIARDNLMTAHVEATASLSENRAALE